MPSEPPSVTHVVDETGVRFELGPHIAAGGQGTVYRVVGHPDYAIKLLTRRNDLHRVRTVRRLPLDGINLAGPITLIDSDDAVGYVMRLADDMTTLREAYLPDQFARQHAAGWYAATGGLRRRLAVAAAVADVLAALHARGLCYVDLNPYNAMVSKDPARSDTWLIDADNLTSLSRPEWTILGLKGYTAPERVVRHAPPSTLADAYALGVLVFSMLVLTHPLRGIASEDVDGNTADDLIDRGELPYVADADDQSNSLGTSLASKFFPITLSGRMRSLAVDTFGPGLRNPVKRPGVARWRDVLHSALDNVVSCSAGCGWTYYRLHSTCPQCGAPSRPHDLLTVFGHGYEQPGAARDAFVLGGEHATVVLPRHLWGRYEEKTPVLSLHPSEEGYRIELAADAAVLDSEGRALSVLPRAPQTGERAYLHTSARPIRELRITPDVLAKATAR